MLSGVSFLLVRHVVVQIVGRDWSSPGKLFLKKLLDMKQPEVGFDYLDWEERTSQKEVFVYNLSAISASRTVRCMRKTSLQSIIKRGPKG